MFSLQKLTTRIDDERGGMIVEYAFLLMAVMLVVMVGASMIGESVTELWSSNTDRYAAAVQPVLDR